MHTRHKVAFTLLAALATPAFATDSFSFTPTFAGSLRWSVTTNGTSTQNNPTLHVMRGQSYDFVVEANLGHPFYVKTASTIGSGNAYGGFSPNGVSTSGTQTVHFDVPSDAPDTLFYNCSIHSSMAGAIDVSIFRDTLGD